MAGKGTELGSVIAAQLKAAGHELATTGRIDAYLDLQHQKPNSLLHDGHAWKGYTDRALAKTQRALRDARGRDAGLFVLASFAFLRAAETRGGLKDPLRVIAETALLVEEMVLASPQPACVVRLGYLYGPRMKDLRSYRAAFRLGRPYWSGPKDAPQDFVHQDDAAAALVLRAAAPATGQPGLAYATDGHPVAFREVMDHFAKLVGNPLPLHLGGMARLTVWVIIKEEHMQAVKLGAPAASPAPTVRGWEPAYPDYREGLDATIAAWNDR